MQCPKCASYYALSAIDNSNKSLIEPRKSGGIFRQPHLQEQNTQFHRNEHRNPKSHGGHHFQKFSPVLLKCGHHVCGRCFKLSLRSFCCSICQKVTLAEEAFDHKFILGELSINLPTEMPISLYSKTMSELKITDGPKHDLCEECLVALLQVRCSECKRNLCDSCSNKIHKSNIFRNHLLVNIVEEYDHNIDECKQHVDEVCNNICQTCDVMACPACFIFGDHKGHIGKEIKNSEYSKNIPRVQIELRSALDRLEEDYQICTRLLSAGASSADNIMKRINDFFVNVHGQLQLQQQNIKEYVDVNAANYDFIVNETKLKLNERKLRVEKNLELLDLAESSELPENICLPVALQRINKQLQSFQDLKLGSNDKIDELLNVQESWWRVAFYNEIPKIAKVETEVVDCLSPILECQNDLYVTKGSLTEEIAPALESHFTSTAMAHTLSDGRPSFSSLEEPILLRSADSSKYNYTGAIEKSNTRNANIDAIAHQDSEMPDVLIKYQKSPTKALSKYNPVDVGASMDRFIRSTGYCLKRLQPRTDKKVQQAQQVLQCVKNQYSEEEMDSSSEDQSLSFSPLENNIKPSTIRAKYTELGFLVTNYVNPSSFYVQRLCDESKLTRLNAKVNNVTENLSASEIRKKMLCLASYKDHYYRAVVQNVLPDERKVEVCFVDYGNGEIVDIWSLLKCPPSLSLENIPPFVIECSISDLVPKNGDVWDLEAISTCQDIIVTDLSVKMQLLFHSVSNSPDPVIPFLPKCQVDICYPCNLEDCSYLPISVKEFLIFQDYAKDNSDCDDVQVLRKDLNVARWRKYYLMPLVKFKAEPVNVKVTHIDSPWNFVLQIEDGAAHLLELMRKMQLCYNSLETIDEFDWLLLLPKIGMACAAKCEDDELWHRAKIDHVENKDSILITFVDTGVKREVSYKALRKINDDFMKMPYQGIVCKLASIMPSEHGEWSEFCKIKFDELMEDYKDNLQAVFYNRDEDVFDVSLVITSAEEEVNIASILIDEGLGEPTEKSLSNLRDLAFRTQSFDSSFSRCRGLRKLLPNRRCTQIIDAVETPFQSSAASMVSDSKGIIHAVNILDVISPSLIFVQFVSKQQKYEELYNALIDEMTTPKHSSYQRWTPSSGNYCIVKLEKSPYFARGKIVSDDNGMFKIHLIDCGGFHDCPKSMLAPMLSEKFKVKPFSLPVSLANIIPPCGKDNWPSSTLDELKDMTVGMSDLYMVKRGSPYIDHTAWNLKVLPVELGMAQVQTRGPFDADETTYISFNDILLRDGLALPKRINSDKGANNLSKFPSMESVKETDHQQDATSFLSSLSQDLRTDESCSNPDDDYDSEVSGVSPHLHLTSSCENLSRRKKSYARKLLKDDADDVAAASNISCQKLPVFSQPAALKETNFRAEVSYVDSDAVIYFHPLAHRMTLQHMKMTHLLRFKDTTVTDKDMLWGVGDYVVARFYLDKSWYRAKILQLGDPNPGDVRVEFIDYGNIEIISIQDIRSEIVFPRTPIQCYKGTLYNLIPVDEKGWTLEVLDYLHRYMVTSEFEVTVMEPHVQGSVAQVEMKRISDNPSGETVSDYLVYSMAFCKVGKMTTITEEVMTAYESDGPDVVIESDSEEPPCYSNLTFPKKSRKLITVRVVQVVDPSHVFIVALPDLAEAIEIAPFSAYMTNIMKHFNAFTKDVSEDNKKFENVTSPEIGHVYMFFSNEAGKWCRILVRRLEGSMVVVWLIDAAEDSRIHKNLIYKLPTSGKSIPGLAIEAKLRGVATLEDDGSWREDSVTAMRECLLGTTESMYATVESFNSEGIAEISLFFKDKDGFRYLCYQDLCDTLFITIK